MLVGLLFCGFDASLLEIDRDKKSSLIKIRLKRYKKTILKEDKEVLYRLNVHLTKKQIIHEMSDKLKRSKKCDNFCKKRHVS